MAPEQVINDVEDKIAKRLIAMASFLRAECEQIGDEWLGLGQVGGQRADHAASLLGRLELHLREIASFATRCNEQIATMKADPFERNAA